MHLAKNLSSAEEFIFTIKNKFTRKEEFGWHLDSWGKGVSFKWINTSEGIEPMSKSLSEFSKAYIYHKTYPNLYKSLAILDALKMINCVLRELDLEEKIENLNYEAINLYFIRTNERYAFNTIGRMTSNLYKIVHFLTINEIIDSKLINHIPDKIRIEKENKNAASKMPNQQLIDFFGSVFNSNSANERDLVTTSIIALLLCAPTRLSEVLNLKHDCEVISKDSHGNSIYGISYIGAKGYGSHIKWIPESMQGLAKTSINNLRKLSEGARSLAQLVKKGEDQFYHALTCKPHDFINKDEIKKLIIFDDMKKMNKSCKNIVSRISNEGIVAKEFWNLIVKGKKINSWVVNNTVCESEALIILYKDQLHLMKGDNIFEYEILSDKAFFADFAFRKNDKTLNIYQRHPHLIPEETSLNFTSHQARHLLNTLAQEEHLSDLEISFWSGRRNVDQNKNYDHISSEDKRENDRRVNLKEDIAADVNQRKKRQRQLHDTTNAIKCKIAENRKEDKKNVNLLAIKTFEYVINSIELILKKIGER